jgi:hypothetical protein
MIEKLYGAVPRVTQWNVRVYTVLYGPYFSLHNRLIRSLWAELPAEVPIEIYLNTADPSTEELVNSSMQRLKHDKVRCIRNSSKKYPLMREMFQDLKDGQHPEVEWVLWFDDDAHITESDWWDLTSAWINSKTQENICYVGQCWFVHWLGGQEQFIKTASWNKNVPCSLVGGKTKKPGIEFAQGSYWWLRRDVLELLDWPDPRILHNGGDTMLAEAVRQQGLPFHKLPHGCFGVKPNDAPRRGYQEAPAGSANRHVRI